MTTDTPITTPTHTKPIPPFEPFPLTWHKHRGYWQKKFRGQTLVYEADATRSYERWLEDQKAIDDTGSRVVGPRKRFVLRDAVNLYLTRQKRKMGDGEITDVQFAKCRRELEYHLPRAIALGTPLDLFRAADPADTGPAGLFHRVKGKARARGLSAAHRHITLVRAVLNHAAEKKLMLLPDYGDDFNPPSQDQIDHARRQRDSVQGERTWSIDELKVILEDARKLREEKRAVKRKNRIPRNHHLYAQILLGLFAACGSDDCSALPDRAVDLKSGVIKYSRAKVTNRPAMAILPKPVVEAIQWSIDQRAKRKPGAEHLLFVTRDGNPCNVAPRGSDDKGILTVGRNDTIGQNFKRCLKRVGLKKRRTGFKTLRAMCRTMLVGGGIHEDVIAVIMGRKFRYPVDDYYIRGDLRSEMEKAAAHLEKVLFTQTPPPPPNPHAGSVGPAARGAKARKASGQRRASRSGSRGLKNPK